MSDRRHRLPGLAGLHSTPANGYVSVSFPVEDGLELSTWTG